jgi:hypothetical protein
LVSLGNDSAVYRPNLKQMLPQHRIAFAQAATLTARSPSSSELDQCCIVQGAPPRS